MRTCSASAFAFLIVSVAAPSLGAPITIPGFTEGTIGIPADPPTSDVNTTVQDPFGNWISARLSPSDVIPEVEKVTRHNEIETRVDVGSLVAGLLGDLVRRDDLETRLDVGSWVAGLLGGLVRRDDLETRIDVASLAAGLLGDLIRRDDLEARVDVGSLAAGLLGDLVRRDDNFIARADVNFTQLFKGPPFNPELLPLVPFKSGDSNSTRRDARDLETEGNSGDVESSHSRTRGFGLPESLFGMPLTIGVPASVFDGSVDSRAVLEARADAGRFVDGLLAESEKVSRRDDSLETLLHPFEGLGPEIPPMSSGISMIGIKGPELPPTPSSNISARGLSFGTDITSQVASIVEQAAKHG